jgi:hypothetical protein
MSTLRQAAQAALDALNLHGSPYLGHIPEYQEATEGLRTALAAPEQEPVATVIAHRGEVAIQGMGKYPAVGTKLYAAPVEPYDQQALELCGACGRKTVIPGEPCLNCARDALTKERDALAAAAKLAVAALEKVHFEAINSGVNNYSRLLWDIAKAHDALKAGVQ